MSKLGDTGAPIAKALSRRKFLALSGLPLLSLAACGDQSGDRQFAGDPRTAESQQAASTEVATTGDTGSPTAVATAMPVTELLAPRGDQTVGIVVHTHELIVVEISIADGRAIWSDNERSIWAAAIDLSSKRVALLTSLASSANDWTIEFIDIDNGKTLTVPVGPQGNDAGHHPDAVAAGRGGIDWLPDSGSVAVSMPTGGLLQVYPDGSAVRLAKAAKAKRPAAVAVSASGHTIAFVEQPSGSDGSGIYAGSIKAKPIDPIVVLPPDRSGNRYARELGWIGMSARVATIIEREELGDPQGELFFLNTQTKAPELAWTSPAGRDTASVESFAISADGFVTAFLTNPSRPDRNKPSSVWLMQTDGPSIERFDLPIALVEPRLSFSPEGLVVTGIAGRSGDEAGTAVAFLLAPNGEVREIYQQPEPATPVASPAASPVASPVASPQASPVGSPSPVAARSGE